MRVLKNDYNTKRQKNLNINNEKGATINLNININDKMTEEDIKLRFINPALQKGWEPEYITMETPITGGQINLSGNMTTRSKPLRADYLLHRIINDPLAVIEAKSNQYSVSAGLQQAKTYAEKLGIPFAYSSNGEGFQEFDFLTGVERFFDIDEFPSREQLTERYYREAKITEEEKSILNQPFYSSQNTFPPRFYQRIAINRVLKAIAEGKKRLLLVMATGTGKTYTAFQIVYRLLQSGSKNKVLYLADRNVLVDQSIEQDFSPLKKTIHKINYTRDKNITSYEVYFSLYQQLIGDNGEKRYEELFKPGFFDLIIVDECHRGSAKADSQWREILNYFSDAIQLGMTATPKETKYVSNIDYFGEPIYTYSLNDGIQDGFLAPFKVVMPILNISDGWRPLKGQKDIFGNEIEDRIYNNVDYDYNIIIQDRTRKVAEQITRYLKESDRMQKTIVFCANEDAAERMRTELSNLNSDMMKEHSDYVVRITSSDNYGRSKLDYFLSVAQPYPVIATTSELLSTGVDTKTVKLIAIDKNISSMTQFKQIIGRGTRIVEKANKFSFVIMDFRGVSRHFADPAWDGEVMIDGDFGKESNTTSVIDVTRPKYKPIIDKNGCEVEIIQELVSVYDAQGKLLKQESIVDYTKRNIKGEFATLDIFKKKWIEKKGKIIEMLKSVGLDLEKLKIEEKMQDVDDFDFICHVAYDKKPLTRAERAEKVKSSDFFSKYSGAAREVLENLLEKYMNFGIFEIEKTSILSFAPFNKFGSPSKIAELFNGREGYKEAIQQLEAIIYNVG